MHQRYSVGVALGAVLLCFSKVDAEQRIRIASYNIQFLKTGISATRAQRLRDVINLLDADVIGIQEVDNRAALEAIFPPANWRIVIDDDSTDAQDLAVVVRKPLEVVGFPANLNAEDANFLFSGPTNDNFFPNRRDVLFVEVKIPGEEGSFVVFVDHAKSRLGGRANTDPRREGAATAIVAALKSRFDDKPFVLLGDFNDNPDDRSLNILETGDPAALAGKEEIDGPFLINLMETLCAAGHVSEGRIPDDINASTGRINTIDPGSRDRNNAGRGTNNNTGDILFDQILFPAWMADRYVPDSAHVFDRAVAIEGSTNERASDHLPVYADFLFSEAEPTPSTIPIRISALLPNPVGTDAGHEEVTIANESGTNIALAGWRLEDAAGNKFPLNGTVTTGTRLTIVMTSNSMPLNNTGDTVRLFDSSGTKRHEVAYAASQATSGTTVNFP